MLQRRVVAGVAGVGGLALLGVAALVLPGQPAEHPRAPVLVELFTSEGCSSCPPADELLISLDEEQFVAGALVIPLSEHVAYWNGSWRDPFSSNAFTERQRSYHRSLGSRMLYTPEMVVDGRRQFVGSQRMLAEHAIAHAVGMPKARMDLTIGAGTTATEVEASVSVSALSRLPTRTGVGLWIAVTEEGLETDVQRGENARRRLRHAPVVRHLESFETPDLHAADRFDVSVAVPIESEWRRSNLRLVAFLQHLTSRHVYGATQIRVTRPSDSR